MKHTHRENKASPDTTPIFCFVEGSRGCHFQHPDDSSAIKEAERLARLPSVRGKKVYILKAVSYVTTEDMPIKWNNL